MKENAHGCPNSGHKCLSLPIDTYLRKWLVHFRHYKDAELHIAANFAFNAKVNREAVHAHFNKKDFGTVRIYMRSPNREKAYYLYTCLKASFDFDLVNYAQLSQKVGLAVWPAIEEFLQKCRITEDELKLETAYKRWQRSNPACLPGIKPISK